MLNRIEAERVRFNLSREELAKKLNISVRTYYNWISELRRELIILKLTRP